MPSISAITPSSFDSGRSVTLTGSGFGASQGSVLVAGQAQTVTSWSDTGITFTTVRGSQSLGACRVDVVRGEILNASLTASGWGQEVTNTGTITGPAPLYVYFDAVSTTHSTPSVQPFGELGYHFDFGYATPSTPGTWSVSGKPKGQEVGGPLAAHVYATPGTYIASVRAQDINGIYQDKSITIVVEDPDTYWTTGGRTTQTLTRSGMTAWPTWASDKRYLLEAGADYSALGAINITSIDRIFIDGGTGTKPLVADITVEPATGTKRPWSQCGIYRNLSALTSGFECQLPCAYQLLINSQFGRFNMATSINGYYNAAADQTGWYQPKYIAIQECTFTANDGTAAGYKTAGWWDMVSRLSLLGVEAHCEQGGTNTEHAVRSMGSYKVFIGHSYFHTAQAGLGLKHFLTLRAMGSDPFTETMTGTTYSDTKRAEQVCVQSCTFGKSTDGSVSATEHTWPFQFGYRFTAGNPANTQAQIVTYGRTQDCIWTVTQDLPSDGLEIIGNHVWDLNVGVWRGTGVDKSAAIPELKNNYSNNLTPDNDFVFAAPPIVTPNKAGT
jgi:hypothetical protein